MHGYRMRRLPTSVATVSMMTDSFRMRRPLLLVDERIQSACRLPSAVPLLPPPPLSCRSSFIPRQRRTSRRNASCWFLLRSYPLLRRHTCDVCPCAYVHGCMRMRAAVMVQLWRRRGQEPAIATQFYSSVRTGSSQSSSSARAAWPQVKAGSHHSSSSHAGRRAPKAPALRVAMKSTRQRGQIRRVRPRLVCRYGCRPVDRDTSARLPAGQDQTYEAEQQHATASTACPICDDRHSATGHSSSC